MKSRLLIPKLLISCPVQRLLRLLAGVISLQDSRLAFLSTIFSKSKITLSMLLTKGQAEVPVFQIWNQPFKTLRVYAKNKVFDCLGTLKDYEKRYPSLVPADRQSLINLDAVQNYDEKKGIAHSVAVRRRSVMLKLNATKKEP